MAATALAAPYSVNSQTPSLLRLQSIAIEKTAQLTRFRNSVTRYAEASRAPATLRGYRADWKSFTAWCEENNFASLPADPDTVAAYIASCADAGLKTGSIQRRVSAIVAFHIAHGCASPAAGPEVKLTMAGIRRELGTRQEGKSPALTADIAAMIANTPEGKILGVRDRALLLVGFAGAFRRSELVELNFEDVEFREDGLKVTIRKSKTDQEGAGQVIGISCGTKLCPVHALREWIDTAEITSGPIFRGVDRHGNILGRLAPQAVAIVIKRYCELAGLDPAKYAGHSLRAGMVTQAAINGVPEHAIMRQTRHKSSEMLRKYIRDGALFRDNASGRIGL